MENSYHFLQVHQVFNGFTYTNQENHREHLLSDLQILIILTVYQVRVFVIVIYSLNVYGVWWIDMIN